MTQEELARLLAMERKTDSAMDSLEERELEVISLLAQGNGFKQSAQEMGLDLERFNALKESLMMKLKLKNDVQLVQFASKQRG